MHPDEQLEQNGYVVIEDHYNASEIAQIRQELEPFRQMGRNPRLAEVPSIGRIVFSPKTVELACELLGGEPFFFPEYSLMANDFYNHFHWHKDNVDRFDPSGADWAPARYPIIKLGVYLQDYREQSGGLAIQPSSHRGVLYKGRGVNVKTKPGDLIVWYPTTTHSPQATSFRVRPGWAPRGLFGSSSLARVGDAAVTLAGKISPLVEPFAHRRQVLFFHFAIPSPLVARYLSYILHRDYFVKSLADGLDSPDSIPAWTTVPFFDPTPFVSQVDSRLQREGFDQHLVTAAAEHLAKPIADQLARLS